MQMCLCLHEPLTSCFPFRITTRKLQAKVKGFLGRPSPAGISPFCPLLKARWLWHLWPGTMSLGFSFPIWEIGILEQHSPGQRSWHLWSLHRLAEGLAMNLHCP